MEYHDRPVIKLPLNSLLVLCGPAGSGKSTFARQVVADLNFRETTIISSDHCRALVCDDENSQMVNRDAFDLFYFIIYKRLLQRCFTIADSTALRSDVRRRMLSIAARHNYYTCLVVFNISLERCLQQDQSRKRNVGKQVIMYHIGQLQQTLLDVPNEGWHQVHIVTDQYVHTTLEITDTGR